MYNILFCIHMNMHRRIIDTYGSIYMCRGRPLAIHSENSYFKPLNISSWKFPEITQENTLSAHIVFLRFGQRMVG